MSDKAKTTKVPETAAGIVETENKELRTNPEAGLVEITIPLDPAGTSDSVYLCVNGNSLLVKRGVPVRIPAAFAEAWRNSQAQELAARQAQQAAAFPG